MTVEEIPFIRPASLKDLPTLLAFSKAAGIGITSMPRNRHILEEKLERAEQSFKNTVRPSKTFLFFLECGQEAIGTAGIISRIGTDDPFFAYHRLQEPLKSSALNIDREIPVLHFARARKKPTEIGTLFLMPAFRQKHLGRLLSLSRFLFIALFRELFAPTVIAELRGINTDGNSPFWNALGSYFFNLSFPEADLLRTERPECIEELFPKYPIYPFLLSKEAQEVIGKPHPETLPALHFLQKQGFRVSHYLDIFDAGPHVFAPTDEIDVIKKSRQGVVKELRNTLESSTTALISNERLDFRACQTQMLIEKEGRVILPMATAKVLMVDIGDPIRYYVI